MMTLFIQLLHSKSGALIQWMVGLFIGWLTSLLIGLGIEIPAESYQQLQIGLANLGAFGVTFAVQWYQSKQAAKAQAAAGAIQDSWIGDETIQAIEDLAKR